MVIYVFYRTPKKVMANISCPYICGHSERRLLTLTHLHFNSMFSDRFPIFYLPYRPTEEAHCAMSCIKEKVGKGIG